MSWLRRRPWLAFFLAAASLRVAAAVTIDRYPLLPDFYYGDARLADHAGWQLATEGRVPAASASQRAHAGGTALLYRAIGRRPWLAGALAGIAASGAMALLAAVAACEVGAGAALAAAAAWSVWPSALFYTSQNLKEPWVFSGCAVGLAAAAVILRGRADGRRAAACVAALACAGLLRSYALAAACLAIFLAGMRSGLSRPSRRAAGLALASAFLALSAWKISSWALFAGPLRTSGVEDPEMRALLVPKTYHPSTGQTISIFDPKSISDFRRTRQEHDRLWARRRQKREIQTQILPDAAFETWPEALLFMPRAVFQVLFAPLPGLHPIDGRAARAVAAAENSALLLLTAAAAWGLLRSRELQPGVLIGVLFFAIMALGTAPFEFDLGSATRHKIVYFPMILPLAFSALRKEPR